jgi:hypothetical protein
MQAFLHQELVSEENLDSATIAQRVSSGVDIWGRQNEQSFIIGPAFDLPDSVLADIPTYASFFAPGWAPTFHEDWYGGEQALFVARLAQATPKEGACVEIGAWEGKSTTVIAQRISPRILHVVDTWQGNTDEGDGHPSVVAARERDVYSAFCSNVFKLTSEYTVVAHRADWRDWVKEWDQPISFLHLDAAHDRQSVRECLQAVRPFFVDGAILCGDDAYADGVKQGVADVFPEARVIHERLWVVEYRI